MGSRLHSLRRLTTCTFHFTKKRSWLTNLVPYTQDEEKWTKHYMAQAMKQIKPKEHDQSHGRNSHGPAQPFSLPTIQLLAQAKSELKHATKWKTCLLQPIKATPEFDTHPTLHQWPSQGTQGNLKSNQNTHHQKEKGHHRRRRRQDITCETFSTRINHHG